MVASQGSCSTDLPVPFKENGLAESIIRKSTFGHICEARRFFCAHPEGQVPTPLSEESGWMAAAQFHRYTSNIPETCWWTIEEELDVS